MNNIILLTIDSLHPDYVGHLGGDNSQTPRIDEIAHENLMCTRAYANGIPTYFAFRSILGGRRDVVGERPVGISTEWKTLADKFSELGYSTAGFNAANPWLTSTYNYDSGFDTFVTFLDRESTSDNISPFVQTMRNMQHQLPENGTLRDKLGLLARVYCTITGQYPIESCQTLTNHAIKWVQSRSDETPFFMWVHYMDPHYPWTPSHEDVTKWDIARTWHRVTNLYDEVDHWPEKSVLEDVHRLYAKEVKNVDKSIGRLLDGVTEDQNTTICITADHGTELGDHGGFSHGPDSLYEELTHVPLILSGDGIPKATISDPVQHVDIPTTLVEVATDDALVANPRGWVGNNLMREQRQFALSEVIYDFNPAIKKDGQLGTLSAIVDWPWKLHWNQHLENVELYNLEDDPDERDDLSCRHHQILSRLRERIKEEQSCIAQEYHTATEIERIRHIIHQIES